MIVFRINDKTAANIEVVSRGYTQQPQETLSNDIKRRVLSAIAFEDNNNTNISCRAFGSPMNRDSNIAVLRIQGELML